MARGVVLDGSLRIFPSDYPRDAAALLILIMMLEILPTRAPAMELKIVGNQIILSGPVVGDEPEKVREALVSSPIIDTVILRNSPGGKCAGRLPGRTDASRARRSHGSIRLLLFFVLAHVSRRQHSLLHG